MATTRCLEKRPERRFPSMRALAAELAEVARHLAAERTVVRRWELGGPAGLRDPEASLVTPLGQSAVFGAFAELDELDDVAKTQVQGRLPVFAGGDASGELDVVTQPPQPLAALARAPQPTEDLPADLVLSARVSTAVVIDPAEFAAGEATRASDDATRVERPETGPPAEAAPRLGAPPPLPAPDAAPLLGGPGSPLLRGTVPAGVPVDAAPELALLPGPALVASSRENLEPNLEASASPGALPPALELEPSPLRSALLGAGVVGALGLLAVLAWFALS
jgi:hypothetical protein